MLAEGTVRSESPLLEATAPEDPACPTMMAMAAKVTIVEVEHLVEPGELDGDHIHTPSIFVQRIFQGANYEKRIERRTLRKAQA